MPKMPQDLPIKMEEGPSMKLCEPCKKILRERGVNINQTGAGFGPKWRPLTISKKGVKYLRDWNRKHGVKN